MELKIGFDINVRCKEITDNMSDESYDDNYINLNFSMEDAYMILFKFTPNVFKLSNGYTMILKFDNSAENKLLGIVIISPESDHKYVVTNPSIFWTEVLDGYEQTRVCSRITLLSTMELESVSNEE